jgi:uncharacterized protein
LTAVARSRCLPQGVEPRGEQLQEEIPMISGNGWRMLRWFIVGLILFWGWNAGAGPAAGPSFDCARAPAGSIEAMICTDPELTELDRALASVYGQAARKAGNERPPLLKAAQRGWIKGRNDCWKSDDKRRCVADSYSLRIVELQARYRLADRVGPVTFQRDHNPANEVSGACFWVFQLSNTSALS